MARRTSATCRGTGVTSTRIGAPVREPDGFTPPTVRSMCTARQPTPRKRGRRPGRPRTGQPPTAEYVSRGRLAPHGTGVALDEHTIRSLWQGQCLGLKGLAAQYGRLCPSMAQEFEREADQLIQADAPVTLDG